LPDRLSSAGDGAARGGYFRTYAVRPEAPWISAQSSTQPWGGPLEDGHANYWRLHGPITLIEYDNTRNDANHIHSVWHDLTRNWGRDVLREHYENGHAHG
jgi:hypothetical protein